jgi:hypothetical protein
MKFSPKTRTLFTDSGEVIKTLHCPQEKRWHQLRMLLGSPHRSCSTCKRSVLDTAKLTEEEVVALVRSDPHTCLLVRSDQDNVTILWDQSTP